MLKPWFAPAPGPRGFVIGPLACIWSGHSTYHRLECLALIRQDGWASRIIGMPFPAPAFAIWLLAPVGFSLWLIDGMLSGQLYPMGAVPLLLAAIAFIAGGVWIALRTSRLPNPIEKALRKEFAPPPSPAKFAFDLPGQIPARMAMDVSGTRHVSPVSFAELVAALDALGDGEESFVILGESDSQFMQTAPAQFGYTIEWRRGGDDWPRIARRSGDDDLATFQIDEVKHILCAYLSGAEDFPGLDWA